MHTAVHFSKHWITDIVNQSNLLFTHNTINNKTPPIFKDYFKFAETKHEHNTVNNLTSTYSIPLGSLEVPQYRTNLGKSSVKHICSTTWNSTLKDLSAKDNLPPFWMNKISVKTLKKRLKLHYLEYYWAPVTEWIFLMISNEEIYFLLFPLLFFTVNFKWNLIKISTLFQVGIPSIRHLMSVLDAILPNNTYH